MQSFTLRKIPLSPRTAISFVQLVLGPFIDHSYVRQYNHFVEVIPDGPSSLLLKSLWVSSIGTRLIAMCRNDYKNCQMSTYVESNDIRSGVLRSLPTVDDIFSTFRKHKNKNTENIFLKDDPLSTSFL